MGGFNVLLCDNFQVSKKNMCYFLIHKKTMCITKKKKLREQSHFLRNWLKLNLLLSMLLTESLLLDLQSSVSNSDSHKHKEHIISGLFPLINADLNFFVMSMTNLYLFLSLFAEYFSVEFFLEHVKNCKSNVIRKHGFQNSKDC